MKRLTNALLVILAFFCIFSAPTAHATTPVITNIVTVPMLTIQSELLTTNLIQYSTNLDQTNWVSLSTVTVTQSPYLYVDMTATGPQRFYRVLGASAPPASHFTLQGQSPPINAGSGDFIFVTARDTNGTVVAGYTGTVHFTSGDPQAILPADYTFTPADAGVHGFSVTFRTAGSQNVTIKDTSDASITGGLGGIGISPIFTSTLVVSASSPQTAGTAGSVTVTATDIYGNRTALYNGNVHFTSTDPSAMLPANYTFTFGDGGQHTFPGVMLKTAGNQQVTVTDTTAASITGSGLIVVTPAIASAYGISGLPGLVTAGVAGNVTVTARDAFGNTASAYSGTVHFSSTDVQASLPLNYTFTGLDAGVHTFTGNVTLKTAGGQNITVVDSVNGSINATLSGITVSPAATASLIVFGFPNPRITGTAGSFFVAARDAFSNTVTSYGGTVHFSSTDGLAVLPADYTFVVGDAGAHSFNATLKTVGTQSITATDTASPGITGTQVGITITP